MKKIILALIIISFSCLTNASINKVLAPKEIIGTDFVLEIDLQVDDTNNTVPQLSSLKENGVKSVISATYQRKNNESELYDVRIAKFSKSFDLKEGVSAVNSNLLGGELKEITVSNQKALEIDLFGFKFIAIKFKKYLLITGVVDPKLDYLSFAEKYVNWWKTKL